jgi:hypothetical protein
MTNLDQSENPVVQRLNRLCQFYEITLLLGLMLLVCGFFVLQGSLLIAWEVACVVLVVASFVAAAWKSYNALHAYRSAEFAITNQRLATLRAVEVPEDVTDYLKQLTQRRFVGEGRFFSKLERALGSERTREVKSIIFKYVRV